MKPFSWFLSTLGSLTATLIPTLVLLSKDLPIAAAVVGSIGGSITIRMAVKTLCSYNRQNKELEADRKRNMRRLAALETRIGEQENTLDLQDIAIAEATSALMSTKRDSVAPKLPTSNLPIENGREATSQRAPLTFMRGVARSTEGASSSRVTTPNELFCAYPNKPAL